MYLIVLQLSYLLSRPGYILVLSNILPDKFHLLVTPTWKSIYILFISISHFHLGSNIPQSPVQGNKDPFSTNSSFIHQLCDTFLVRVLSIRAIPNCRSNSLAFSSFPAFLLSLFETTYILHQTSQIRRESLQFVVRHHTNEPKQQH